MPYYKDIAKTSPRESIWTKPSGEVTRQLFHGEHKATTSFRSRPLTSESVIVPDQNVDPYAYYLPSMSLDSYRKNMEARGFKVTNPMPDRGHPFETQSFRYNGIPIDYDYGYISGGIFSRLEKVSGAFLTPYGTNATMRDTGPFIGDFSGPATFPSSDLANFGQRAIVKKRPSVVVFDLGRAVAELREGIPRLGIATFKGRAEAIPRNAGGDYLNVVFGWKPLISDIKSAIDVLRGATELLDSLPIEGRPVRRTWSLPPKTEMWSKMDPGGKFINLRTGPTANLGSGDFASSLSRTVPSDESFFWKKLYRKQWFVGAWTTFYPLGFDPQDFLSRAKHMMSMEITPATLWELAPWSWLVDWALHIGDSLAANQAAVDDNTHMHYAYSMEHTVAEVGAACRLKSDPSTGYRVNPSSRYGVTTATTEWKRRIRANPFGFTAGGLSGLNGQQLAILAALGLSRT